MFRSILDAGWGQLISFTEYKAVSAGRSVTKIRAPYTSQTCADCGHTDAASRPNLDRFCCTKCGHEDHADANAAVVILAVGEGRMKIRRPRKRKPKQTGPGLGQRDTAA